MIVKEGASSVGRVGVRGWRILLVDDHRPSLDSMRKGLGLCGHRCESASSVGEVFPVFDAFAPEAVVIEWNMDHGRGRQLSTVLDASARAQGRRLAIYFVSTQDEPPDFSSRETFDRYFTKPVSMLRIAEALLEQDAERAIASLSDALAIEANADTIATAIELRARLALVEATPVENAADKVRRASLRERANALLMMVPRSFHGVAQMERLLVAWGRARRS